MSAFLDVNDMFGNEGLKDVVGEWSQDVFEVCGVIGCVALGGFSVGGGRCFNR